jgi:hypothetical protein
LCFPDGQVVRWAGQGRSHITNPSRPYPTVANCKHVKGCLTGG